MGLHENLNVPMVWTVELANEWIRIRHPADYGTIVVNNNLWHYGETEYEDEAWLCGTFWRNMVSSELWTEGRWRRRWPAPFDKIDKLVWHDGGCSNDACSYHTDVTNPMHDRRPDTYALNAYRLLMMYKDKWNENTLLRFIDQMPEEDRDKYYAGRNTTYEELIGFVAERNPKWLIPRTW